MSQVIGQGLIAFAGFVARGRAGMRTIAALAAVALLAACGKQGELMPKPPPGETPRPVAGPSPTERLEVPTQAQPERADDPLRRSEARRDDPFALPPK